MSSSGFGSLRNWYYIKFDSCYYVIEIVQSRVIWFLPKFYIELPILLLVSFLRSFRLLATNAKLHSFDQFTRIFLFPVNKTNRTPSLKLKHQLLKFHAVVVVVDDFLFISRLHRFMLLSVVKGSCPQAHIHDRFFLYHHTLRYFTLLRRCFDEIYFILFWSFRLRNSYYKVSLQSHKVYRLSLKCYYKLFSFSSENSSPSIQKLWIAQPNQKENEQIHTSANR